MWLYRADEICYNKKPYRVYQLLYTHFECTKILHDRVFGKKVCVETKVSSLTLQMDYIIILRLMQAIMKKGNCHEYAPTQLYQLHIINQS